MDSNQYYKILNLQAGASNEKIEKAYRDLVVKWKNNDFALKEIHEAYQNIIQSTIDIRGQTKTPENTNEKTMHSDNPPRWFMPVFLILVGWFIWYTISHWEDRKYSIIALVVIILIKAFFGKEKGNENK